MKSELKMRDEEEAVWTRERLAMVADLRTQGIRDSRILDAMTRVRRHVFIPEGFREHGFAYGDHAYPIGRGQTISQPFIVAYMIDRLKLEKGESVLEIGAGSGYQAAVLAELGMRVYSVEIVPDLARHAREALEREGYGNRVDVHAGDGSLGWPEKAPFDAMMGACAADDLPPALPEQLREGGRIIFPLRDGPGQRLVLFVKTGGRLNRQDDLPVAFVPLVTVHGG
jgi:protein-L-isoaspartate(D-aspartate) O-methyltransferase